MNQVESVGTKIKVFAKIAIACPFLTSALALDRKGEASLRRLDPEMRLEQICDVEAMERIRKESSAFAPDRAKSDVITRPQHLGDLLKADGAAFRSNYRWYELSFVCKASPDHMSVYSFNYKIGNAIPKAKWKDYGLWR